MKDDQRHPFFDFVSFLMGESDNRYEEIDSTCLSDELFNDSKCQRKLLPLYFFLTRNPGNKMTVAQMKKQFKCGADTISRVKKAIQEKKQIPRRVTRRSTRCEKTPL